MPEQRSRPRDGRVIALANQKGGTGKTTTTVNLGIGLARLGKKVLLIDADPQGDLTTCLGWQNQDSLSTTLATVMEKVIRDEPFTTDEGILHHSEGVDLMPANIELSALEMSLVNAMSREFTLRTYVNEAKKHYDVVLIDCMPSLGMITINALAAADSVIIPVQAHYLPAKGMTQLMKTIGKVKRQINPALKVDGVLLTLVDGRTNLARQTTDGCGFTGTSLMNEPLSRQNKPLPQRNSQPAQSRPIYSLKKKKNSHCRRSTPAVSALLSQPCTRRSPGISAMISTSPMTPWATAPPARNTRPMLPPSAP